MGSASSVNSTVVDVNKEIQAFQASKADKHAKLQTYEARIEALDA